MIHEPGLQGVVLAVREGPLRLADHRDMAESPAQPEKELRRIGQGDGQQPEPAAFPLQKEGSALQNGRQVLQPVRPAVSRAEGAGPRRLGGRGSDDIERARLLRGQPLKRLVPGPRADPDPIRKAVFSRVSPGCIEGLGADVRGDDAAGAELCHGNGQNARPAAQVEGILAGPNVQKPGQLYR